MNISLTKELEKLVNDTVKSGMYNSASEVIRAALRIFKQHEQEQHSKLEELRREINLGLEDSKKRLSGPLDFDTLKMDIRRNSRERKKAA